MVYAYVTPEDMQSSVWSAGLCISALEKRRLTRLEEIGPFTRRLNAEPGPILLLQSSNKTIATEVREFFFKQITFVLKGMLDAESLSQQIAGFFLKIYEDSSNNGYSILKIDATSLVQKLSFDLSQTGCHRERSAGEIIRFASSLPALKDV